MAEGTTTPDETQELTDGFNLIIDAMKLNGVETIYGVPGIPITDFGRMAQASGIRVLSFRHEQNAGYARHRGVPDQEAGHLPDCVSARILNGLTALAHATTNCFPMILISGSSEREIVDLQQGDYEEMDQLAIASRSARRPFVSCLPKTSVSVSPGRSVPRCRSARRRLSRLTGQAVRPGDGRGRRTQIADQGD